MKYVLILLSLCCSILGCSQQGDSVDFFKDTGAYELAKAIDHGDLEKIIKLVKQNTDLLEVTDSVSGSNVLALSINLDRFEPFKKLLELGANPNFINPFTKYSVLINAIKPYGSQFEWRNESKYVEFLLEYGADPNYAIENDFTNQNGIHVSANSPLLKASRLDLTVVKVLIKNGADPYKSIGERKRTPIGEAIRSSKFDIATYFIDSLEVDIYKPVSVVVKQPEKDTITYYIQDYVTNKFTRAKILENREEMDKLVAENTKIERANQSRWEFIQKLEAEGMNFKEYDYINK